ncbi:hypothetical protein GX865_00025 [Candidatus Saccharibacteria bacterium]|nr:hypothetical protein [Candidatus Saccharibacteria bacterium]
MAINYLEKTSQLNQLPAIIIYPQSLPGERGVLSWQGAPYSPKKVDDIGFINDIIDTVTKSPCVDRKRVYSIGVSNGGGMSWLLSCNLSHKIAAFAMVAGAYYAPEVACKPKRPAAILSIHGELDKVVPINGSIKKKLPPIDMWIERRAKLNKCLKSSKITSEISSGATMTEWTSCKNNATVQSIRLNRAGHSWPKSIKVFFQDTDPIYYRQTPIQMNISTAEFIYESLQEHHL